MKTYKVVRKHVSLPQMQHRNIINIYLLRIDYSPSLAHLPLPLFHTDSDKDNPVPESTQ
jgi:hypothetical protein